MHARAHTHSHTLTSALRSDALWRDVCAVLESSAPGADADAEQHASAPASTAGGGVAPPLETAYRLALAGNDDLVLMRLIERSGPALHRVSESCAERVGEALVRWLACNRFVDLDIVVLASAMQHSASRRARARARAPRPLTRCAQTCASRRG